MHEMVWCSHITWQEYGKARHERGGFWGYSDSQKHPTNICKNWVECPECKAPRPMPRPAQKTQRLWEIIEAQDFEEAPKKSNYVAMADSAKSWFIALVKAQRKSMELDDYGKVSDVQFDEKNIWNACLDSVMKALGEEA